VSNGFMLESAQALRRPQKRFPLGLAAAVLCSLAFVIGCAAYAAGQKEQKAAAPKQTSARFTQLAVQGAGDVAALTLNYGGERFTLIREDEAIVLAGEEIMLDQAAARELLSTGASILSRQTLGGDKEDYGICENALHAEYCYENGETLTIILGDAVPTGEGWYAAVEGEGSVHVVNNALAAALTAGKQALYALPDLRERFTANTLLSAEIALPGQQALTLERVTKENPFNTKVQLISPIRYPANAERAAEVYLALEEIRPTGVAQVGGADEDWGLSRPLAVLTLRDQSTTTLTLGKKGAVYTLRIGGDQNVYTVDGESLEFLSALSVPYLAEQLPALVMLNQVSRIDVHAQGETFSFTTDQSTGTYTLDGKAIAPEAFVPAYQQMIGLLIERYAPDAKVSGEPRIRIEFTLRDGRRWAIAFAGYDERFDLVVRDGCACFLIGREKTDAMLAAIKNLK